MFAATSFLPIILNVLVMPKKKKIRAFRGLNLNFQLNFHFKPFLAILVVIWSLVAKVVFYASKSSF